LRITPQSNLFLVRQLNESMEQMTRIAEHISTGKQVSRAADDPAGMAIAQRMEAQAREMERSIQNSMDSVSMLQTADGALSSQHEMLQQMRELSVQASNGTLTAEDRAVIQQQVDALSEAYSDVYRTAEFNGKPIFDPAQQQQIRLDVSSSQSADASIGVLDDAISSVSEQRAYMGAVQNSLEHNVSYMLNSMENTLGALSQVQDADMAREIMDFTTQQMRAQGAVALAAQSNLTMTGVLDLLGNP